MILGNIINTESFKVVQDSIAEATEMAIITVDYKGVAVTKHSNCSEFCKMVRKYPKYRELCEKCDSRGGLEAVRTQKPYIYVCHAGLVDFATPIIVNGQYLGSVMAGQVLIEEKDKEKLEQIVNDKNSRSDLMKKKEINDAYKLLPVMTLDKVESLSKMMFHISSYIVKEAKLKMSLNEMNEKFLEISKPKGVNEKLLNHNNFNLIKQNEIKEVSNNEIKAVSNNDAFDFYEENLNCKTVINNIEKQSYKGSLILKPALEYIQNNCNESISLNNMASLCNISPSYFSKLFKREIKENFASYVNKVKIKKAKELLQNSDAPVINISIDLGFEDCGYFIKVFKKIEKVTPAIYRKKLTLKVK